MQIILSWLLFSQIKGPMNIGKYLALYTVFAL